MVEHLTVDQGTRVQFSQATPIFNLALFSCGFRVRPVGKQEWGIRCYQATYSGQRIEEQKPQPVSNPAIRKPQDEGARGEGK